MSPRRAPLAATDLLPAALPPYFQPLERRAQTGLPRARDDGGSPPAGPGRSSSPPWGAPARRTQSYAVGKAPGEGADWLAARALKAVQAEAEERRHKREHHNVRHAESQPPARPAGPPHHSGAAAADTLGMAPPFPQDRGAAAWRLGPPHARLGAHRRISSAPLLVAGHEVGLSLRYRTFALASRVSRSLKSKLEAAKRLSPSPTTSPQPP